jgi:hypothetical protein
MSDPVPIIDVNALAGRFERFKARKEFAGYDDLKRYARGDGNMGLLDDTFEDECFFPRVESTTARGAVQVIRGILNSQCDNIMPRPEIELPSGAKHKVPFYSLSGFTNKKGDSLSIESNDDDPDFRVVYLNLCVAGAHCMVKKEAIVCGDGVERTFWFKPLFSDELATGTIYRARDASGRRNIRFGFCVEPGTVDRVLDVIGTVICSFEPEKNKD